MTAMFDLGSARFDAGDLDAAEQWFAEGYAVAREVGDPWYMAGYASWHGHIAIARGDVPSAVRWHEAALTGWDNAGYEGHVAIAREALGLAWHLAGDNRKAAENLEAALRIHVRAEGDSDPAALLERIALLVSGGGQAVSAVRLLAAARRLRRDIGSTAGSAGRRQLNAAMRNLEATLGPAHFSRAWHEGEALTRDQALTLGQDVLAAQVDASPGLTRREHEVLALLVEGASDEEIAARLFITRRTASKHVGAILTKLGAANRTVAVTMAHRHNLV
jgi:non-specific serine/threonine protein kinase